MSFLLGKLFNIVAAAGGISSGALLSDSVTNTINGTDLLASFFSMVFTAVLNFFATIIYAICQFALAIIDLAQLIIYKFLGITTDINDYVVFDKNNPLIRFITNDTVLTVVKSLFAIAIVLVIVFTIISIIKSEYQRASNDTEYNIKRIWGRAGKAVFGMVSFPIIFIGIILLINSLLAGFSSILGSGFNGTVGSQVFATCAYDANVYRNYAENNQRIPIYINFNDPYDDGTYSRYTSDELASVYSAFSTNGNEIYNLFANGEYSSMKDTLTYNYKNNTLVNNSKYSDYEKFICTPEQYQVMADFIDYATTNNIKFYYKAISDSNIDWKYVDEAIFDPNTGSLRLTYSDSTGITNDRNSYTVTYAAQASSISTPIQDALSTLKTLLSLDGEAFNVLDSLDGSINTVSWASNKVELNLSNNYKENPTVSDQIILYEYYRYKYNNTLQEYSINQLEQGIKLDSYKLECQYYRDYTNSYVTLKSYDVVILNGHYYLLSDQPVSYDSYGDPIYSIIGNNTNQQILSDMSQYNEFYNKELGVYIEVLNAYYSANYDTNGNPINSTTDAFCANTQGERFTVNGENIYGFVNSIGEICNVDRLLATKSVKEVGWASKLTGDLQTIYRDLNLQQLIATGEWLEIFNSTIKIEGNSYTASFDTSLISPLGLILSELFLGTVVESDGTNLGKYMFTSAYSTEQQNALLLAIMGEENFETLRATITYFVEMFNMLFEPMLEDIIEGEGLSFTQGEVTSIQLYTYKAYLASLLLSSDSAQFFLDIAKELVVMHQFNYDVLLVEPYTSSYAKNVVKEYCTPNSNNGVSYMLNLSEHNINLSDYGYTYDTTQSCWVTDNTEVPQQLIDDINAKVSNVYMSLADIIIEENINNEIYYGFSVNLAEYGFIANGDGSYSYPNNMHSARQLEKYDELTSYIYSKISQMLTSSEEECFITNVYNNVKNNLIEQGVAEGSYAWPAYMNQLYYYMTGSNNRLDIILSNDVITDGISGIYNEYDSYQKRLNKAYANLNSGLNTFFKNADYSFIHKYYPRLAENELLTAGELIAVIESIKDITNCNSLNTYKNLKIANEQLNRLMTLTTADEKAEYSSFINLAKYIDAYIQEQDTMDSFNKYSIVTAIGMNSTENVSKTFNVVVNNHSYSMKLYMPSAQLTEYLLGGVYLNALGYETVFVDSDFTGFFDINYVGTGDSATISLPEGSAEFKIITDFIKGLADTTVQAYYYSNLFNITSTNVNAISLSNLFYKSDVIYGDVSADKTYLDASSYTKLVLQSIVENRNFTREQVLKNMINTNYDEIKNYEYRELLKEATTGVSTLTDEEFFDLTYKYIKSLSVAHSNEIFNSVMAYLFAEDDNYASYTYKDIRIKALYVMEEYVADSGATVRENKQRFLTLFNILCSDFIQQDTGVTTVTGEKIVKVRYINDSKTKTLILKLVGLENMPEDLLVGLEYDDLYQKTVGYDENNGDTFIICTKDELTGKYVPFLASTSNKSNAGYKTVRYTPDDKDGSTWLSEYGYGMFHSKYYTTENEDDICTYPIIAKGIITNDGYPTAIKQIDGVTAFYRSEIVVRNASKLQLNKYFVDVSQISVNYNLISAMTNAFSTMVTGKSLVEHAMSSMPLYAIDSSVRLPYGVSTTNVSLNSTDGVLLDYAFSSLNGLTSNNFYNNLKINYLILIIAILALLPIFIKSIFGVMGRVIDITLYYTINPIMMSTIALGKDVVSKGSNGKKSHSEETLIYTAYYKKLSQKTLSIFAYVIGFQIFFLLVPFISTMELFTSTAVFAGLPLFSSISANFINQFIRVIFLICSAYLIKEAPELFAKILNQDNGFKESENVIQNVKGTLNDVKNVMSGAAVVSATKQTIGVLEDISGVSAVREVYGNVKKAGAKVAGYGLEFYARVNGVPKETAKKARKMFYESVKAEVDEKRKFREERRNFGKKSRKK